MKDEKRMHLKELEKYNPITIQCHDNPDADALGSGYGLYCYFKSKGKEVRLIYSGRNRIQKTNLKLMVEKLAIPVEYIPPEKATKIEGLLLLTDCQYGGGNVTRFEAEHAAVIDHHQEEIKLSPLVRIQSNLGSCSTLVWSMLKEEAFPVEEDTVLGTALYYGLYTDTNQFSEIYNPLDMDMREALKYNKSLITLFRNSNLSLKELEIAGIALIRYSYNDDYRFAVIPSQQCDPNILGLISDFLIQVDEIDTCVVYNEAGEGYKFSVRSCVKEVKANELAAFLAEGIGSGGGHTEKAGGFISKALYETKRPNLHSEGYFNNRMTEYFDSFEIIDAVSYEIDLSGMEAYCKKKVTVGYVKADEALPVGTPITIRTLEGDVELTVEESLYIIIGIKGEVYPNTKEKFERSYRRLDEKYCPDEYCTKLEYIPTIKNRANGKNLVISELAKTCVTTGEVHIYAKPLEKGIKVFTEWDREKYMLGRPGDFLAVRCDDKHDIYVVEKDIFYKTYEKCTVR